MLTTLSIDRYQAGDSPVHRLDPRVKLLITLGYIITNVLYPDGSWLVFSLAWGILLLAVFLGGIRVSFVLKRSLLALPFALAAFTVMFTLPGEPIAQFTLGPWDITLTDAGLDRFLSILVRSWLSVQIAVLLTATTKFQDLAHGLRHLHLPQVLIAIISFMYRYIFVLVEETERLLRARAARSALPPGHQPPPLRWRARVAGNMVGQLFIRSFERSERVYYSMLARGFRGQFLTFTPHVMNAQDWAALLVAAAMLLALLNLAHLSLG